MHRYHTGITINTIPATSSLLMPSGHFFFRSVTFYIVASTISIDSFYRANSRALPVIVQSLSVLCLFVLLLCFTLCRPSHAQKTRHPVILGVCILHFLSIVNVTDCIAVFWSCSHDVLINYHITHTHSYSPFILLSLTHPNMKTHTSTTSPHHPHT